MVRITTNPPPSILITDSEDFVCDIFQAFLTLVTNWRSVITDTNIEALELASREEFDVVISDLNTPYKDGFDFIKDFKAAHPLTPIIINSGSLFDGREQRAYELGAFRCIPKGSNPELIFSTIQEAIEHHRNLKNSNNPNASQNMEKE